MTTQPINLAQLEHLMFQDHQEAKHMGKQKRRLHFEKRVSHQAAHIDQLKNQQKNAFHAALWGFFVSLFSQAALFIPKFGALVSGVVRQLGNLLNPFGRQAQQARIHAEEYQLEASKEAQHQNLSEENLKRLAEHRQEIRQQLKQGLADQQAAQTAAVRI